MFHPLSMVEVALTAVSSFSLHLCLSIFECCTRVVDQRQYLSQRFLPFVKLQVAWTKEGHFYRRVLVGPLIYPSKIRQSCQEAEEVCIAEM